MDVGQFFNYGGYTVPNPNYDKRQKKNPQPQYILDKNPNNHQTIGSWGVVHNALDDSFIMGDTKKVRELGVTPYKGMDEQAELADNQSAFAKIRNSLAQTVVSEIGLGTLRGFADLFDYITGAAFDPNDDYSNPVSAKLREWQEKFKNEVAPIYQTPGVDISNGGLTDIGWWASNFPSVASSLTLLLPSTGVTKGLSYLGRATKAFNGVSNLRKGLTGLGKLEKAVDVAKASGDAAAIAKAETALKNLEGMSRFSKWANSKRGIEFGNRLADHGITALTSRVMENFQEANQVYNDLLPEMKNKLYQMDEQEYNNLLERNADELQDVDTSDKDAVAKRLASAGANRTFKDDMANVVFDVAQLYALRDFKSFMNGPSRASIRRAHLNQLRNVGVDAENVAEKLAKRPWYKKAGEKIEDAVIGSRIAVGAQLSEGVEEAVNYIAQEEGMNYGRVLLGTKSDSAFFDRLEKYMVAPQLYESAFWGVAGGVIFQAAGSKLNRLQNAYNYKQDQKARKNEDQEKTGEKDEVRTSWSEAFEHPEIKRRKNDINSRAQAIQNVKEKLHKIQDEKVDPFDNSENPRKLETAEEQQAAADRVYREFASNLLINSMFAGNYNMTKEYLASNNVKRWFVEQGVMSQEEADRRQREALNLADKIEVSFDGNMRILENAMHGKDDDTGIDFGKVPYDFYQIVAMQNMRHELNAETYDRIIDNYQPLINSEEERLAKEVKYQGVDFKNGIKAFILARELGEVEAQLQDAKKTKAEGRKGDIDNRTLVGQSMINKLETRKQVLEKMLGSYIEGDKMTSQQAKQLSILRAASATVINDQGEFSYDRNNDRYRAIDAAIIKANEITRNKKNGQDTSTEEEWGALMGSIFGDNNNKLTREQFDDVYYHSELFDELVGQALGSNGLISSLDDFSKDLLNAYSTVVYAEIGKQEELASIATGREQVQQLAHDEYNMMLTPDGGVDMRTILIEQATSTLKSIAKNKNEEFGDISKLLAYGTINKNQREQLKQILNDKELENYDSAMRILALSNTAKNPIKLQNSLLPRMVKKAIYWSMRDNFEDVVETTEDADETIDRERNENQQQSSTENQNPSDGTQNQPTNNPPQQLSQSNIEDPIDFVSYFSESARGEQLQKPFVHLTFDDNGKPNAAYKSNSEVAGPEAELIPVENSNDTFDLEFRNKVDDDLSGDVFGNEELFNGTQFRLQDGAVVTRLPRITLNNDGTIVEVIKGEIAIGQNPADLGQAPEQPQSPSTGEQGNQNEQPEDAPAEEEVKLGELQDEVIANFFDTVRTRFEANEEITDDIIKSAVSANFADKLTPEQFNAIWENFAEDRQDSYDSLNASPEEFEAVGDAMESAISDKQIGDTVSKQSAVILDEAFDKVLNNYIKHAYVNVIDGIPVVSLANLLTYCNEVAGNKLASDILYEYCARQLQARQVYILETLGGKELKRNKILQEAKSPVEESVDTSTNAIYFGGRTLDFTKVLKDTKDKKQLYKTIYNLKVGDTLTVDREENEHGKFLHFYSGNTMVGTITVPEQNATSYVFNLKGWVIDIPKSNDGSISAAESLFIKAIANPEGDPKFEEVKRAMFHAHNMSSQTPEYNQQLLNIMQALYNAEPSLTQYLNFDIFGDEHKYDKLRTAAKHLLSVYEGYLGRSSKWLQHRGMSEEEYRDQIRQRVVTSISDWFTKLAESAEAAHAIFNNPNATVTIKENNIGGLKETTVYRPVNQENVIGEVHKGEVFVAVKPFDTINKDNTINTGKLTLANGVQIPDDPYSAGNTKIAIRKPNGTFVFANAFPAHLDAQHLTGEPQQIVDEVFAELGRLMEDWAFNEHKSSENIYNFLSGLCHARNGNTPLFGGIKVSRMTGGKKGITISYVEEGKTKYINLYDESTYKGSKSLVSNIQYSGKQGHKFAARFQDESGRWIQADGQPHPLRKPWRRVNDVYANKFDENFEEFKNVLSKYMQFAIHPNHVNVAPFRGQYCSKRPDGSFVVSIPGGIEHVFTSYNDYIINNGLVTVNTIANKAGTNFTLPGENDGARTPKVHFDYSIQSSSTGGQNVQQAVVPNVQQSLGDEILSDIQQGENDDTVGKKILDKLLTASSLKTLKQSKIIGELSIKNIKFVKEYRKKNQPFGVYITQHKTIDGVQLNPGDIIVTQRWIDLINEDTQDAKDEAVRHLVHEHVHKYLRTLPDAKRKELFDELRSIFNDFVEANNNEGLEKTADSVREFEYDRTAEQQQKYRNADGTINDIGLEEFLVESLTRPKLIKRLNEIQADGKKITKQKFGNIRKGTLFQRILAAIAKAFGLGNLNRGSLLEKEYKLFEQIADGTIQKQSTTNANANKQLTINFEKPLVQTSPPIDKHDNTPASQGNNISPEVPFKEPTESGEVYDELDDFENPYDNESAIGDNEISSLAQIRDTIIPENRKTFEHLVQESAIEIEC